MLRTEPECLHETEGWYLVARDGDLVLRVRPGMQLGEDEAGELVLDPADPQVALTVCDDGSLQVSACADRRLALDTGRLDSHVQLERHARAKIHLANNVIALAGDFTEAALTAEPPAADAANLGGIIVVPEPPADTAMADPDAPAPFTDRLAERLADRLAERLAETAAQPAASLAVVADADHETPAAPPTDPVTGGDETPPARPADPATDEDDATVSLTEPAFALTLVENRPARPARARGWSRGRIRAVAIAAGIAAAAVLALLQIDWSADPAPPQVVRGPATAPREAPVAPANPPTAAAISQALASVDALLAEQQHPDAAALTALAASLEALLIAAPEHPELRRQLAAINQRLASHALPADGADRSAPAPDPVPQNPAAGPVVELVLVPPIAHKPMPEPSETVAAAPVEAAPPQRVDAPSAAIDLASFQIDRAEIERIRANAVRAANERTLRAAADALARGRLVKPEETSAYALYSRVLASDPDAELARIGIQSIRGQLLGRIQTALAADDVGVAAAALDDAAIAGLEPATLAELRAQIEYRQRLHDALAGRPGILFPITELAAIRQDPPTYPRHAPAGAEGTVEVEMTVTETGEVRNVTVLGNPPMYFLRATKQAVQEWRFAPVLFRGEPVAVRTAARVTFRDEDGS